MTDQDILDQLRSGELKVDVQTAVVRKNGKELAIEEKTHGKGPQKGTYRFVQVCGPDRSQKKIALHRLVWMAANDRLVPNDCDIDHKHSQKNDTIGNLRLLDSNVNRRLGAEKSHQDVPF